MIASTRILDILDQAHIEAPKARAIAKAFEEAEREIATDVKGVLEENLRHFATKADLAELKAELIKWTFGMLISQALVVLGGVFFIVSHSK